jgi:hypothetical protein
MLYTCLQIFDEMECKVFGCDLNSPYSSHAQFLLVGFWPPPYASFLPPPLFGAAPDNSGT